MLVERCHFILEDPKGVQSCGYVGTVATAGPLTGIK